MMPFKPVVDDGILQAWNSLGYVVLREILPEDIFNQAATFLSEQLLLWAETFERLTHGSLKNPSHCSKVLEQSSTYTSNPDEQNDIIHLARGEFPIKVRIAKELKVPILEPALLNIIQVLLDASELFIHSPPSVRLSMPGNVSGLVPPHQDWVYNQHLSRFLTCWVPYSEAVGNKGGLRVWPRSHQAGQLEFEGGQTWVTLQEKFHQEIDKNYLPVDLDCRPGDVVLFHPLLVHASRSNTSDKVRMSVDYRFFPASIESSKAYCDLRTLKVYLPSDSEKHSTNI